MWILVYWGVLIRLHCWNPSIVFMLRFWHNWVMPCLKWISILQMTLSLWTSVSAWIVIFPGFKTFSKNIYAPTMLKYQKHFCSDLCLQHIQTYTRTAWYSLLLAGIFQCTTGICRLTMGLKTIILEDSSPYLSNSSFEHWSLVKDLCLPWIVMIG
jgi:hypothetical protein